MGEFFKRFAHVAGLVLFALAAFMAIFAVTVVLAAFLFEDTARAQKVIDVSLIVYIEILFLVLPYIVTRSGKLPGARWIFFMIAVFVCLSMITTLRSVPIIAIYVFLPLVVFVSGDLGERARAMAFTREMSVEDRSCIVRRVHERWDML